VQGLLSLQTDVPQPVRDYLDDPAALYVSVCGTAGDRVSYYGAANLVRAGEVCRYSSHELTLSSASPPRLERKATTPSQRMLLSPAGKRCPLPDADLVSTPRKIPSPPGAVKYAAVLSGVPQDVFEQLAQVWRRAISSPASFDRAFASISRVRDEALIARLRNAVMDRRLRPTLQILSRRPDRGPAPSPTPDLEQSYDLNFEDPDHWDRTYHLTMSRSSDGIYQISEVRAGIY
jgi:hypothetical protein